MPRSLSCYPRNEQASGADQNQTIVGRLGIANSPPTYVRSAWQVFVPNVRTERRQRRRSYEVLDAVVVQVSFGTLFHALAW